MTDPHSIANTVHIPPYLALPSLSTRKPPASSEHSTYPRKYSLSRHKYTRTGICLEQIRGPWLLLARSQILYRLPSRSPGQNWPIQMETTKQVAGPVLPPMPSLPSNWIALFAIAWQKAEQETATANGDKEESRLFLIVPVLTKQFTSSSRVSHGFVMMIVHRPSHPLQVSAE